MFFLLRIIEMNCDELRTHPGFALRAIAAGRAYWRAPFIRYPHAYDTEREACRGAHFAQSPRKMSSNSRRIRLSREPEAGLGTSYHSMSSTLPQRSQMKW